jgi:DNA-binding NarL/FixJ family response regulator
MEAAMDAEERARQVWSDLIEGRSAVEHRFDQHQRRFLVVTRIHSEKEQSTLRWLVVAKACTGRSNKQIAHEMGISESTVSAHLRVAVERLGASSLVELVAWPWSA